ncbi:MAG TPA: OmpA family protein [Cellvibrio sp.]|nr:OmpA family protein [Cellvibrio sp.]
MNCHIKKIILFFAFVCGQPVFSGEQNNNPGWYAGARAGYSSNEHSCMSQHAFCDKADKGYGFFTGYELDSRFGIELSWNDIGDSRAGYENLYLTGELKQADASLIISHSLYGPLTLYGKMGVAIWEGNVTGGDHVLNDIGMRPLLGAGLQLPVSRNWFARVEYQYIDKVGNKNMGYSNPHFFGVSILWHFNSPTKKIKAVEEVVAVVTPEPKPESEPVATPAPQLIEERITLDEQWGGLLFETDKTELHNTMAIEPIVKLLIDNPLLNVSVTGHTDARGRADYNQRLSEQRAQVVVNYLQVKGISPNRITVFGLGETMPVADNETEVGRAKNRRVEFVVRGIKSNP